jgi:hypothetical protein
VLFLKSRIPLPVTARLLQSFAQAFLRKPPEESLGAVLVIKKRTGSPNSALLRLGKNICFAAIFHYSQNAEKVQ